MKITVDDIRLIQPLADIQCSIEEFDYVDIIGFSSKPKVDPNAKLLWCAYEVKSKEELTWYGTEFSRVAKAINLPTRQNLVLLADKQDLAESFSGQHILVPDVKKFLEDLYRYVIGLVAPAVIGVTGSVGKTTCVALLEEVFSQYGNTLRVYSKRITPLNLFEMVINQLELNHRYIVMEYAMFYRWHVEELVRLLKPTVGILLNVSTAHLGIDTIHSSLDIFYAKKNLLDQATYSFIEHETFSKFSEEAQDYIIFRWEDYVSPGGLEVVPFVKTKLQYMQIGAALSAKEVLIGKTSKFDIDVVNRFSPKENRLQRLLCRSNEIFFDGEVTVPARLHVLGDSMYSPKALVIHAVSDTGEYYVHNMDQQKECLVSALEMFDYIYLSESVDHRFRSFVANFIKKDLPVVIYKDRIPEMPTGTVFVHWGSYWREYSDTSILIDIF